MDQWLVNLLYVVAAVLFILGLRGLTHPRTAVRGNLMGASGMLLAVVVTLLDRDIVDYRFIIAAGVLGGATGLLLAVRIKMTGMPQLVALFNGFGGIASVLVAGAALFEAVERGGAVSAQTVIAGAVSGLIGAVTFLGSLVAFAKLQSFIFKGDAIVLPGQQIAKAVLGLAAVGLAVWTVLEPGNAVAYWSLVGVAAVLGVALTIPIGGADMPVVIALLNSYSGLAAAATGFVLNNNVLIIAGSLVGASGFILTSIMCKAMNRSLTDVLFGVPTPAEDRPSADSVYAGRIKSTSPDEVAMLLDGARRVVVVPGYGMAVSQAQHAVSDLGNMLEARGTTVEYAVHPVAGRMPGHMNVLLAEADVPYEKLKELDEVNATMEQTDVCIVIGANDVVNPVARTDPSSPIGGMPIINADKAQTVVVIKRSLSPGFAGIPNPLFAADNTLMLFCDGRKAFLELISAVEENE